MLNVDLSISVQTTEQIILGYNPARKYALFVNDGLFSIYLGIGKPAQVSRGPRLNANGGSYEINATNPITNEIHAIADAGASVLTVTELS